MNMGNAVRYKIVGVITQKQWLIITQPRQKFKVQFKSFIKISRLFNPIFKENVQRQKHLGSCAFAEPELLSYRKLKIVVQKVKNGHKNPNNSHKYDDENHDEIEFHQGNSYRST